MSSVLRTYELTYLLPGSFTDSEVARRRNELDELFKKYQLSIEQTEEWGRRQLAYRISYNSKHETEGIYFHLVFQLNSELAPKFERDLQLSNKVMRHLLVVAQGKAEAK